MKEKITIFVGAGIAILVIFTAVFYLMAKDTIEYIDIITEVIILKLLFLLLQ